MGWRGAILTRTAIPGPSHIGAAPFILTPMFIRDEPDQKVIMGNQIARTAHRTVIDSTVPPAKRNDRWLTPLDVINALGRFDLDPCGAPGHPTADRVYLLEAGDDGLRDPWWGRVWLNPPYGRAMRGWVELLVAHGSGTALIPVATGTKLWQEVVWREASAIHFYRHRINFLRRDGQDNSSMVSPQASAIVAFGDADADALIRSDLPGVVLDLRTNGDTA